MPFLRGGGGNRAFFLAEAKTRKQTKHKKQHKKTKRKKNKKNKKQNKQGFRAKWGGHLGHLTWPLTLQKYKKQKKTTKKTKKKKEGGFRAKWRGPSGHLTWPLNPPKQTQKQKKKQRKKRKNKKTRQKRSPKKNSKNTQKLAFQLSVKIFFFFGWLFKISLFWHLGPESAHPKNTIKIGVSGPFFFGKQMCVTKRPFLDQKKPKFINFSYHFFCLFLLFQQQKNPTIAETPIFIVFLANQKKDNFQKKNLKHWKLKKPNFAPLFWKRLFLDNWKITENKKNTKW